MVLKEKRGLIGTASARQHIKEQANPLGGEGWGGGGSRRGEWGGRVRGLGKW